MKNIKQCSLLVIGILYSMHILGTIAPLGMLIPYNLAIVPEAQDKTWQLIAFGQGAYKIQGFDVDGNRVNPLQVYETQQNALAMFQGHEAQSSFVQILNGFAMGPGGVLSPDAGLFSVNGDFDAWGGALAASYALGKGFAVQVYIPYWSVSLNNISWTYVNQPATFADAFIENQLFSAFATDAQTLFGLSLDNWKQNGFGDLTFLLQWQLNFPQYRSALRNVHPHLYMGLAVPTGKKPNINNINPVGLGCEGALSIPFGGGLNINVWNKVEFGAAAQFWFTAGNTQQARVQTFSTQTSLLLPDVTYIHKEFGFTQDFNLFVKAAIAKGTSIKLLYEYMRISEDQVYPISSSYDYNVANDLPSLDEKTYHHFLIIGSFDGAEYAACKPQISAFVRIPFNGMSSISSGTYGLQVALEF